MTLGEALGAERRRLRKAQRGWGPPAPRSPGAAARCAPPEAPGRSSHEGHWALRGSGARGIEPQVAFFPPASEPIGDRPAAGKGEGRQQQCLLWKRPHWGRKGQHGLMAPTKPPCWGRRCLQDRPGSAHCRSAGGCGCQLWAQGRGTGPGIGGSCRRSRDPQGMSIRIGHPLRLQPLPGQAPNSYKQSAASGTRNVPTPRLSAAVARPGSRVAQAMRDAGRTAGGLRRARCGPSGPRSPGDAAAAAPSAGEGPGAAGEPAPTCGHLRAAVGSCRGCGQQRGFGIEP